MKNKTNIIIGSGALVFLLPFLGLPQPVDNVLYVLSGLVLIALGIRIKLSLKEENPLRQSKTYEENNKPFQMAETKGKDETNVQ